MRKIALAFTLLLACCAAASAATLHATIEDPIRVVNSDFTQIDFYGTLTYELGGSLAYERYIFTSGACQTGFSCSNGPFPVTMEPGDSYTGLLFSVRHDPWTHVEIPPGTYQGYVWFGAGMHLYDDVYDFAYSERLDWTVTIIPEPSSLLALAAGLVSLAGLAMRRRK